MPGSGAQVREGLRLERDRGWWGGEKEENDSKRF